MLDFTAFSSLLRITAKYEMPAVRSQMLDVVHDAYPENFEGLAPSKPLGQSVFSGLIPRPNEVLNLCIQQNLASALPIAYYMVSRRGPNLLVGRHLPRKATLSPEILQPAFRGLASMALREMELNETHRLIFELRGPHSCPMLKCLLRALTYPESITSVWKGRNRS